MYTKKQQVIDLGYDVGPWGSIVSPGKFQGEPWAVPLLWHLVMVGAHDEEGENGEAIFDLNETDQIDYGLEGVDRIILWEDDYGFVHSESVVWLED